VISDCAFGFCDNRAKHFSGSLTLSSVTAIRPRLISLLTCGTVECTISTIPLDTGALQAVRNCVTRNGYRTNYRSTSTITEQPGGRWARSELTYGLLDAPKGPGVGLEHCWWSGNNIWLPMSVTDPADNRGKLIGHRVVRLPPATSPSSRSILRQTGRPEGTRCRYQIGKRAMGRRGPGSKRSVDLQA